MAQISPILSPSHFLSCFLILCRYFLLFFFHSRLLGLFMPGKRGRPIKLPITAQLIRQEQQLLRDLFRDSSVLIWAWIPLQLLCLGLLCHGSSISLTFLCDPQSAILLTTARTAAQPSMTTPELSSPAMATSMSTGLPPTATSSPIISAVPPLPAIALNSLLSLRVSGELHHGSGSVW